MAPEVAREVGLVAEADGRSDLDDRLSLEETPARGLDSTPEDVRVRCDTERPAEAADEVRRVGPESDPCVRKRHSVERMRVEECPKPLGELVDAAGVLGKTIVEMRPQALHHEREVRLRFERIVRVTESLVQEMQATA